jgi:hypothetical protein
MQKIWMLLLICGLAFAQNAGDAFRKAAFLFAQGNLAAAELELRQAVAQFPKDPSLAMLLERVLEIREDESSQNKNRDGNQDQNQDEDQSQEEQSEQEQKDKQDPSSDDDEFNPESEEEPELNQPEVSELDTTEVDSNAMDAQEAMEILKNFTDSLILPPNPAGRRTAPERAW